jgi:steroid 5-alpha reductase family enzyme
MYICVICTTNIWTLLRCFFETWAIDVADGDSGWVDNVRGNQE